MSSDGPTAGGSFLASLRSAFQISNYWYPGTGREKAQDAESKLLARASTPDGQLPNPGVSGPAAGAAGARVHRYSGSAATARLELVDIGDGQYINTLIIDREAPATAVPATRETGTGAQAPKGTHDLLADLNSEMTSGHVPPSELPAHSHNVLMHDYGVLDGADLAVSASMAPGSQKKTLVLAHGYGAALGFFFKNYYALSTVPGYRTIAFDWLGMGNSSRPAFPSKRGSKEVDDRPERAETFFVESLEAWRKAMKLDSFILAGHSLGGYLSVCYALKYPERVEKLILISPVGIPEPPNTTTTADGRVVTVGGGSAPGWAARLWELNVTPFSLIRTLGPWGKGLVERYTYGRLGLEGEEGKEFAEYYWNISTLRGSGEYALASLLSPGAWARRPLLNRLKELRPDLQVTAIYGQQDWMDYRHFLRVPWTERSAPVRTIAIPQAGHQLFLDNPSVFNKVLIMEMLEVKGQRARYGQRERDEGIKVWETSA